MMTSLPRVVIMVFITTPPRSFLQEVQKMSPKETKKMIVGIPPLGVTFFFGQRTTENHPPFFSSKTDVPSVHQRPPGHSCARMSKQLKPKGMTTAAVVEIGLATVLLVPVMLSGTWITVLCVLVANAGVLTSAQW